MDGPQHHCTHAQNVENWNALRGLLGAVTETGAEVSEAFHATSALCHKGTLQDMWWEKQVAQRVLTLRCTERHQNLTRKSVDIGLANIWSTILKVTNICKLTNADET